MKKIIIIIMRNRKCDKKKTRCKIKKMKKKTNKGKIENAIKKGNEMEIKRKEWNGKREKDKDRGRQKMRKNHEKEN